MPHLAIALLGGFQVALDGHPLKGFKSNKVRALLAFLAVEADRPHRREMLAGLLWPERSDRDALNNLRYSLANLRKTLDDRSSATPFLLIDRDTIQFNRASDAWLDVHQVIDRIASARNPQDASSLSPPADDDLRSTLALYRGSLLESFSAGDAAPFEEWLLLRREQIAQQITWALAGLVALYEARGDYPQAQAFARRHVALEPWNEDAHRGLMRVLALDEQRSAALHQFQACRRMLEEELGVEPAEETIALFEAIRQGVWIDKEIGNHPGGTREQEVAAAGPASPGSPLVARENQLSQLDRALAAALAGEGRVVFVAGEAGSGKTVLLDEFTRRAMPARPDLLIARGACDAATGIGDPYLPFREILQLLAGDIEAKRAGSTLTGEHARRLWTAIPDAVEALVEHGPDLIDTLVPGESLALRAQAFDMRAGKDARHAQLQRLLRKLADSREGRGRLPELTDIFQQTTHVLHALARRHPLCLVLDDLQWADAGSASLLFHLGRRITTSRILVIAAYRPDGIGGPSADKRHPLKLVVNELQRISGLQPIDLDACDGAQFIDALLDSEPNRLDVDFRDMLLRQTEGHPLFTVELLHSMEARGSLLRDDQGFWTAEPALHWDNLPTRVEAVIAERIDRLPDSCQLLLDVASVEGQEFTAEAAAVALGEKERDVIQCLSGNLDERHRLVTVASFQRIGTHKVSRYRFRHYLFWRYLYDHLDTIRRATLHEAIGSALETLYAGASDELEALAPRLAWHFEMADHPLRAAAYYLKAGRRASLQAAHEDALRHLTRGLALLETLPVTAERERLQLELQLASVPPLSYTRGFWSEESARAMERAYSFSLHPSLAGDAGLWTVSAAMAYFRLWSAQPAESLEISQRMLRQAESSQDDVQGQWASCLMGFAFVLQGRFSLAVEYLDRASAYPLASPHPRHSLLFGINVESMALAWKAVALWVLGYPDQATGCIQSALSLAHESSNAITVAHLQSISSVLLFLCARDPAAARKQVEALRESSQVVLPFGALADSLSDMGDSDGRENDLVLKQMRQGFSRYQTTGNGLGRSGQLLLHAQKYAGSGQVQTGLDLLDEALQWIHASGVSGFEAEAIRLRGELLLMNAQDQQQATGDAAASFREAIAVARQQGARWWELRATVSLAKLVVDGDSGIGIDADVMKQTLSTLYGSFSEGFDSPDLCEAATLLNALGQSGPLRNPSLTQELN